MARTNQPLEDNTTLQRVLSSFAVDTEKLYANIVGIITEKIAAGVPVGKAVDDAFREVGYAATMETFFSEGIGNTTTGASYGTPIRVDPARSSKYFLFTNFAGGENLSARLHNGDAQRLVKSTLKDFFTKKTGVEELFRSIRDGGFDTFDGLPRQIDAAIAAFRDAGGDVAAVTDEIRAARNYIKGLSGVERSSAQLQRSYSRVLDAIEKNDDKLLKLAVDRAVNAKVGALNKRIARTEFARAYDMTFSRGIDEDDGITGYQVLLSSRHYPPDICDVHAESDSYGLGPGVYPKDVGASIPFHPNCLCGKLPIRKSTKNAQFSQKRVNLYLKGLPDANRASIVGVANATNQNNYAAGLASRGFNITNSARMIPQDLYTLK